MEKIISVATEMTVITPEDTAWLHKIQKGADPSEIDQEAVSRVFLKLFAELRSAVDALIATLRPLVDNSGFASVFATVATPEQLKGMWSLRATTKEPESGDGLLHIMASVLSMGSMEKHEEVARAILEHCIGILRQSNQDPKQPVHALSLLMKNRDIRNAFVEKRSVALLTERVVGASVEVQLLYELGLCLWLLTFTDEGVQQLLEAKAIAKLHDTLKNFKKEKCARIALQCLSNFTKFQDQQDEGGHFTTLQEGEKRVNIYSEMISLGLLRTLEVMSRRTFADGDVNPLIDALVEKLEQRIEDVSSFAEYKQEVESGRLEWSPVHKSERFWKENMKEFEAGDYSILRELSNILNSSTEPEPICVALHDFGEFVRFHPMGRKVVNALPVKAKIIQLLDDSNEDIKKEALMCTQKLLVKNWEFLA